MAMTRTAACGGRIEHMTLKGRERQAAWTRERVLCLVSLIGLLFATGLLYIINLDASGYANQFYSAAAQAGSTNWWSFLWGSSDAGNSITVDKPPAAIWPMALSVKIFGLSSWSILLPQAVMGVLSTWLLYAAGKRVYGHWAGILASAALAVTPIACLMFRFNNPDALLMLLLVSCVYCILRACQLPDEKAANRSRTKWMVLAGIAMGFAFLTKQLQAFLILPGIGIAFLLASPTKWSRKMLDSLAAFGALIVSAGWWVLLTVIVPADMRPYIGGSQTNSFLELTFSYNGLGRITGSMEGAVLPGASQTTTIAKGQSGMWGQTGITRLFDGVWGTQWSWIAIPALAGIVIGLLTAGRGWRSNMKRASIICWGGWLITTGLVFSFMGGTIHQYYTVALAPAAAALFAICVIELYRHREKLYALILASCLAAASCLWTIVLLRRSSQMSGLAAAVPILTAAGLGLMWTLYLKKRRQKNAADTPGALNRVLPSLSVTLLAASILLAPTAYSIYTASIGHTGSIVTAGPSVEGTRSMGGRMNGGPQGGGMNGGPGGSQGGGMNGTPGGFQGGGMNGTPGGSQGGGQQGTQNGGQNGSQSNSSNGAQNFGPNSGQNGAPIISQYGSQGKTQQGGQSMQGGQRGQGGGSLLDGSGNVSDELVEALQSGASDYRWAAATVGSQNAASYQLASECSVMPIGGFNGSDPSPTLEQFKAWVKEGKIHYFIASGSFGGTQIGGSDTASQITSWVEENYSAQTIGGTTVYDLTQTSQSASKEMRRYDSKKKALYFHEAA